MDADLLQQQMLGLWCASRACRGGVRLSHPLRRTRLLRSNPVIRLVQILETHAGVPVSRRSRFR
jgi:hypothetical protein